MNEFDSKRVLDHLTSVHKKLHKTEITKIQLISISDLNETDRNLIAYVTDIKNNHYAYFILYRDGNIGVVEI